MTDAEYINHWLMDQDKTRNNEPKYRLVWSDDQREYRHGTFNDFYGEIFLRSVTEVRFVPKYSYISERWILEKWIPPERAMHPELPESYKGSYEVFYVFEAADGSYLKPTRKVVEFIINADRREIGKLTPEERRDWYAQQEVKQRQADIDSLGDSTALVSLLHNREAITVPDLSKIKKETTNAKPTGN